MQLIETGGFTIPGESGYEELTLNLARSWGADMIRDCDGTELSSDLISSGLGIYSTICLIRGHNEWAKKNPEKLQQTFLSSEPVVAMSDAITLTLLSGYYREQFRLNDTPRGIRYWQVFDRTAEQLLTPSEWSYDATAGAITIRHTQRWHTYTVSFLVYRIWEEISMYNHVTNYWGDKEHLVPIEPFYPETQTYLKNWLQEWCCAHPYTSVVRFTAMFYNFVWIWGEHERRRNIFSDWASYDFTVSDIALDSFARAFGYELCAEDFINKGKLHATHQPASRTKLDWMNFINDFTIRFGKELIDIVHSFGKKAMLFFDDSWVGTEPTNARFQQLGFDGVIKCGFSAFEVRLLDRVNVQTRELRLHPYLFPTGVDGSPSFLADGDPASEAKRYWVKMRRALLRVSADRIGLGGYLHLVQSKPDFIDAMENIAREFRALRTLHKTGAPDLYRPRIAVLHFWGKLRPWTLSGHFHETCGHDLIHVNESLAGLPFDVDFIDFEEVMSGEATKFDVVINCGAEGTAWSGGESWRNVVLVEKLTEYVYQGGLYFGIDEPSAISGCDTFFRMAHVMGVDKDKGDFACHGKWKLPETTAVDGLIPPGADIKASEGVYLTREDTKVLLQRDSHPLITTRDFGKGKSVYLSSYHHSSENARLLQNLLLYSCNERIVQDVWSTNTCIDCAYFPVAQNIACANETESIQETRIYVANKSFFVTLEPYQLKIIDLSV